MGRLKDFLIDMQGDAEYMARDEWIAKYGKRHVDIYDGTWEIDPEERGNFRDVYDT